jgi:hypothetical protein
MFSVSHVCGTRWRIVDKNRKPVFIGSSQSVEDWLDYQENRASRPAFSRTWRPRILHAIVALTREIFGATMSP